MVKFVCVEELRSNGEKIKERVYVFNYVLVGVI